MIRTRTWYCPSGATMGSSSRPRSPRPWSRPNTRSLRKSIPPARQTQKTPDVCIPLAGDERGSRSEEGPPRARRRPRRARGALAPRLGARALEPLPNPERARDRGRARGRGRRAKARVVAGESNSRGGVPVSSGRCPPSAETNDARMRRGETRPSDHRRARPRARAPGPRSRSAAPEDSPRSAEREPLDARRRRGVRGPRRTPRGVFLSAGTANHPAFLLVLQTRVWAR